MFIELAEFLRCPEGHEESFLVVAPDTMRDRMVVRGVAGCPVCRREYPIEDGLVRFGDPGQFPAPAAGSAAPPDPDAVAALTGLLSPGGFGVLVGSATRLAAALAERLEGVHWVGVNPPAEVMASPDLSLLAHPATIPLRSEMARTVVLGAECAVSPWTEEAARVLLHGQRLVATAAQLSVPGLVPLAAGGGLWVGEKRAPRR